MTGLQEMPVRAALLDADLRHAGIATFLDPSLKDVLVGERVEMAEVRASVHAICSIFRVSVRRIKDDPLPFMGPTECHETAFLMKMTHWLGMYSYV